MAVRAALGAGRGRLVRQLLTESLLLFALGAGGGVLVAMATTRALERIPVPSSVQVTLELSPDGRVILFALGVALLTGLIFGVSPALQGARTDITSRLRDGSAGSGTRRGLGASLLIVGQLAMSLVLLVGAGLFLRALERGADIDPGFDTSGVATAMLHAESWGYDAARSRELYRSVRETLEETPGVTAVAYANRLPLVLSSSGDEIRLDGAGTRPDGQPETLPIQLQIVEGSFFDVVRLPLLAGRPITDADDERAPRVVVVNETLARRIAPDGDALGRSFHLGNARVTVVGVARDAKYASLRETTPPFAYFPMAQRPEPQRALMVRTSGDPGAMASVIRRALHEFDPALPVPPMLTLDEATGIVLFPQRIAAIVTGTLGLVGLLLAAVGLYGVIAFSTTRRTREIGIRLALGARGADVLRMIVGEGMRLAGIGVAVGVLLAAAATRVMASLLFDVSPLDPLTFAAMSALFVLVALAATWLPARRAARAEPMSVLRSE
jgi:predicted permease